MTSLNIMQQLIEANEQRLLKDQQQDTSGDESIKQPGEGLDVEAPDGDRLLRSSTPGHALGYW